MKKIYVFRGENKDIKKLTNMISSLSGLSFVGVNENFCGLKLSEKLERRIKLFHLSSKKPRKYVYLHKIISKSTIYSETEYSEFCKKIVYEKFDKKHYTDTTYKKMPKGITKDNQEGFNSNGGGNSGSYKSFCTKCHFTHKYYKFTIKSDNLHNRFSDKKIHCPNCGAEDSTIGLYSSVRVPRKNASEKVWKNFYKLFVKNNIY